MKRILIFLCVLAISMSGIAQTKGMSKSISVHIVKEIKPANLNIVSGSLEFVDKSGNNTIDANETCYIRFKIKNTGVGEGIGCKATIRAMGATEDLSFQNISLRTIPVGATQTIEFPIKSGMHTKDGSVTFVCEVTEPQGFGTDPAELTIPTKAFVSPYLQIVDYSITSSSGGTVLQKKVPFDLQLMLQNTQYGRAEDVTVELNLPEGVFLMDGNEHSTFAEMEGGKAQSLVYSLAVANNYTATSIPVSVTVSEKFGKYAENKTITLQLNQSLAANKLNVNAIEQQREEITIAQIGSSVDKNIPKTHIQNKNTFVLIIANEKYYNVAPVPFALNDGTIFQQYCLNTLGIPSEQITFYSNATLNQIRAGVNWLQKITRAFDNPNVIVYYAGHGIPDESSKTAYLLPVDGNGVDVATGYKLDDLYAALGGMPASQITVFMDACFSGSKREEGMLASARGIALKVKSGTPKGNMVVFSAAQGDETAYPYNDEGHGMFTYFLLKKLQETAGDIDLYSLGEYIIRNVKQQSILKNGKDQTPTVIPSAAIADSWKAWTLLPSKK